MKSKIINHSIVLLILALSSVVNARQTLLFESLINNLPSSPLVDELLSCKAGSGVYYQLITSQSTHNSGVKAIPKSLEYLNDVVKTTYNTMRNGVISYVTKEVALSLLNLNIDGFAAENIANYVSEGTKPYLPFKFANGVKITKVTPKGKTIIYRAEMPITKNHSQALPLALAGKASARATICNDMEMVDNLLGRNITIQYNYYDSKGVFFSSFTING